MELSNILNTVSDFLKSVLVMLTSYLATVICPIENYLKVIVVLAAINIIMGLVADHGDWDFSKAFKGGRYLLGYLLMLIVTSLVCMLMYVSDVDKTEFVSWITWAMIYFYVTNIFRNWHLRQPDNRVISFLYWVLSFKIVDKVQYLKEFLDQEKSKKKSKQIENTP